jgi:hypothetical protein
VRFAARELLAAAAIYKPPLAGTRVRHHCARHLGQKGDIVRRRVMLARLRGGEQVRCDRIE